MCSRSASVNSLSLSQETTFRSEELHGVDTCHQGDVTVLQRRQLGGSHPKRYQGASLSGRFRADVLLSSSHSHFCALTAQVVSQTHAWLSSWDRQDDLTTAVVDWLDVSIPDKSQHNNLSACTDMFSHFSLVYEFLFNITLVCLQCIEGTDLILLPGKKKAEQ